LNQTFLEGGWFMGQAIPEEYADETSASVSTNPNPQQDSVPEPHSPEASPGSRPLDVNPANAEQEFRKREPRKACRTDSGKLHRVKHGILSREALDALVQLGEDRKTFRRLERQYRAALRPTGPLGDLFFDRFWSSYLKLILVGRLETKLFAGQSVGKSKSASLALVPGRLPTLVSQDPDGQPVEGIPLNEVLPPDLLHGLVLVQRYDRHHAREMYRALAMVLLLRRGGEPALEDWASEMVGAEHPRKEN
jgi:hypothetical protein